MPNIKDVYAEGAQQHVAFVQEWCDRCGYAWLEISSVAESWLAAQPGRKGVCLPLAGPSGPEIRLLALAGNLPTLYVSGGILKGVVDQGSALEAVNSWTRSNPAFPCFLAQPDPNGFQFHDSTASVSTAPHAGCTCLREVLHRPDARCLARATADCDQRRPRRHSILAAG